MNHTSNTSSPEDTRARIMAAASRLFADRGFSGTTTRTIADSAGVNEVTIFRHFGTKANLIKAIIDRSGGPAIAGALEAGFSGDYTQDLALFGQTVLKAMVERGDAMRMAICEAGQFPEIREVVADNPRQLRRVLARYFERKMKDGEIHIGHPEVLAQAFLGMFFSYVVLRGFLGDSLEPEVTTDSIVDEFTRLFIRGTQIAQE